MDEKRQYIITMSSRINRDARLELLQWAVINLPPSCIREKPDGCRVYLDRVPDDRIEILFNLLKRQLS